MDITYETFLLEGFNWLLPQYNMLCFEKSQLPCKSVSASLDTKTVYSNYFALSLIKFTDKIEKLGSRGSVIQSLVTT